MDALIRRFPLKRVIIPADSVIISRIIVLIISLSVLSKGMTVSMIYCRNSEKVEQVDTNTQSHEIGNENQPLI